MILAGLAQRGHGPYDGGADGDAGLVTRGAAAVGAGVRCTAAARAGMRHRVVTHEPSSPAPREVLAGLVERVTFHHADSGFCVLRIKARGHRDLITVIGHAAVIAAGEWVTASGAWVNDRTHGPQFKAHFLRTSAPTSVEGIEKYLGSGMIRGIGPVYAQKLVRAFGETVFEVIEAEPDRLREVTGIGPVRAPESSRARGLPAGPAGARPQHAPDRSHAPAAVRPREAGRHHPRSRRLGASGHERSGRCDRHAPACLHRALHGA